MIFVILQVFVIGIGAIVHGAIGIGFPMIATPLLSMFMGVEQAVLLLVIPTVILNIANIFSGRTRKTGLARYWLLAAFGIIGSYLGTHLLIIFDDIYFRPVLAGLLIFYLYADRLGLRFSGIKRTPRLSAAFFGLTAGLCGGTVNVMLPPLVIFALEMGMDKTRMIQVFNLCFLTGKLTQGLVFMAGGLMTPAVVLRSIPMGFAALLVMLAAMQIRNRIDTQTYKKWLRIFIAAMAVVLLIKSVLSFSLY